MISSALVSQILNIFLLLATVLASGLGIFIWLQNRKSPLHIIFGLLSLSIVIWLFGTFMMLSNCTVERLVVFWDRFLYSGVIFIPVFLYHFGIELTEKIKEKIHKTLLFIGYIMSFLFLLLSRTDYFVKGVFYYKWGCHTTAQIAHHLFLIPFSFYILFSFYLLWDCIRKTQDPKLKNQAKYVFISFVLLYIGSIEYLPAYQISVFPIGYAFPLIWLGVLAYAITRYQLLNIKVIATDVLVGIIIFTILVFTVLSENIVQFIGRGTFLILVSIFGWLAIRGVHREVEEKERLEQKVKERTKEIEKSKKELEKTYQSIKEEKEKLERLYKATIGRELRMIELKKEIKKREEKIKELEEKLKKTTTHPPPFSPP